MTHLPGAGVKPFRISRPVAAAGVCLLAAALLVGVLAAAEAQKAGPRIADVLVRGNHRVSTHRILGQMQLRAGSAYDPAVLDEDLKRLYALGEFDNVVIQPERRGEELLLIVEVTERPVLKGLEFQGNTVLKDETLQDTVGVLPGSLIDRHKIFNAVQAIERQYREKGHYFVSVELDETLLQQDQVARYAITEGPRVRVRHVEFQGNASVSKGELTKRMETKKWFPLLVAGLYEEEKVERDIVSVRNYYVEQGFLDVQVGRELEFSPDKEDLTLRIIVEEGPRYHVRSVALEGVERFSRSLLKKQMTLEPGEPYTAEHVKNDVELVRDTYGEVGYIHTAIKPVIDFTEEPGQVDVVLKVEEGEPVEIGEILIQGNRLTQDKVIRRELRFYPEEPLNMKLVEKAEKRLKGTGLFARDSVSITPIATEEPGMSNVLVRVEETETANLILGAGVSSNSGVLGNISLSQRNFDAADWPKSTDDF